MNIKEIIDFEINNILIEFKTKFDLQKFKSIKNIEDKINYAKTHLQILGEGSSRITFLLSNRFVLKVALSDNITKGQAQNKEEIEIYKKIKSGLLTKIYDFDSSYEWLVAELVRTIRNNKEFEKLTNIEFEDYSSVIYDIEVHSIKEDIIEQLTILYKDLSEFEDDVKEKEKYNRYIGILNNNNFTRKTIFLIEKIKLDPTELTVLYHWGKTVDGRAVLLDFGATEEVIKNYYN